MSDDRVQQKLISARISGSLGVLVEEAQPERRLGRSVPVCFRSLRFPTYLISKRSLRRSIFSFLCVMGAHQGAFMPRHSGSSSHSTLIPAHQPVIQAPYIITCTSHYIGLGHGRTDKRRELPSTDRSLFERRRRGFRAP